MSAPPVVSVIVPARGSVEKLERCLSAILDSDVPRSRMEIVVVDDASEEDGVMRLAEGLADRCIRIEDGPRGPAHARNLGVRDTRGDTLVFVDSDVVVHPSTISGFVRILEESPEVGAAFGAYDAEPSAPGLISRFRNLQHRYVHMRHAGPAETFWAGCGAVRRGAFLQVEGFDDVRYRRPQVEDIELGHRLRDAGWEIRLAPELQGKHLKKWTLIGGMITDVRHRGGPWMELLLRDRFGGTTERHGALNLETQEKMAALLVLSGWLILIIAAWSGRVGLLALALLAWGAAMWLNLDLLRWFRRVGGTTLALAAVPLRLLYYSLHPISVLLGIGLVLRGWRGREAPLDSQATIPGEGTQT